MDKWYLYSNNKLTKIEQYDEKGRWVVQANGTPSRTFTDRETARTWMQKHLRNRAAYSLVKEGGFGRMITTY